MKRIIFVVLVVAGAALAGESWVGTVSPRAGNANNRAGGTDAGFVLPANAKITVQCGLTGGGSANSYVCIDKTTCSASLGVNLTSNQALPTSTATSRVLTDGGMSGLIPSTARRTMTASSSCGRGTSFEHLHRRQRHFVLGARQRC